MDHPNNKEHQFCECGNQTATGECCRHKRIKLKPDHTLGWLWRLAILAAIVFVAASCSKAPQPVRFGEAECVYCKMRITNPRFASQAMSDKGKRHFFDSIECLMAFRYQKADDWNEQGKYWVPDFTRPNAENRWIKPRKATYVQSDSIHSPMGLAILAFGEEQAALQNIEEHGGTLMSYQEAKDLVIEEWEVSKEGNGRKSGGSHDMNM